MSSSRLTIVVGTLLITITAALAQSQMPEDLAWKLIEIGRVVDPPKTAAGAEDIGTAVQWVSDNIAARGGDNGRIYLMGHSAGAAHVAGYVSHPEFYKVKNGGLKGAIMVSGIYDLTTWPAGGDVETAYYGADQSLYPERSALKGLLATDIPLMFASAELDLTYFIQQLDLMKMMTCKGPRGCARTLILPQHNHMSEVYAINTPDTRLTDQILEFMKTGK